MILQILKSANYLIIFYDYISFFGPEVSLSRCLCICSLNFKTVEFVSFLIGQEGRNKILNSTLTLETSRRPWYKKDNLGRFRSKQLFLDQTFLYGIKFLITSFEIQYILSFLHKSTRLLLISYLHL